MYRFVKSSSTVETLTYLPNDDKVIWYVGVDALGVLTVSTNEMSD